MHGKQVAVECHPHMGWQASTSHSKRPHRITFALERVDAIATEHEGKIAMKFAIWTKMFISEDVRLPMGTSEKF